MKAVSRRHKLIGGVLCLDFANTADWHGRLTC